MSWFLLFWVVFAVLVEHALALTPVLIENPLKKALYYVIIAPEIALEYAKTFLGKFPFTWLAFQTWFRM